MSFRQSNALGNVYPQNNGPCGTGFSETGMQFKTTSSIKCMVCGSVIATIQAIIFGLDEWLSNKLRGKVYFLVLWEQNKLKSV